ncbi:helix-turn-helix domain-containing protein [Streptomyces albicerus]|uniref:helix-turn-helix domain-containing protein n=1 Tax=Streptomyces albicerus TaxID=2569859 RepID=UPI001788C2EC|nr:helix-turn-helix transcriptional regulator [Streptomyces albicerus]
MGMSLAERLRVTVAALLHATGESQASLAGVLGVTQGQVSRRQSGTAAWSLDDCDVLAAHYGIDVLDLLAGPSRACEELPDARRAVRERADMNERERGR